MAVSLFTLQPCQLKWEGCATVNVSEWEDRCPEGTIPSSWLVLQSVCLNGSPCLELLLMFLILKFGRTIIFESLGVCRDDEATLRTATVILQNFSSINQTLTTTDESINPNFCFFWRNYVVACTGKGISMGMIWLQILRHPYLNMRQSWRNRDNFAHTPGKHSILVASESKIWDSVSSFWTLVQSDRWKLRVNLLCDSCNELLIYTWTNPIIQSKFKFHLIFQLGSKMIQ